MTLEDAVLFQRYGIKGYNNETNGDMSGKGKEAADKGRFECEVKLGKV